jgi:hypothetical protein
MRQRLSKMNEAAGNLPFAPFKFHRAGCKPLYFRDFMAQFDRA